MLIFISCERQPLTYWLSTSYAPSSDLSHFMPSFGAFHATFWAILHTKTAYIVCRFDYEIIPHASYTTHHLSFMRPCSPPKRGFKQLSRVHTFLLSASLKEPINWVYKAFFAFSSIAFLPYPYTYCLALPCCGTSQSWRNTGLTALYRRAVPRYDKLQHNLSCCGYPWLWRPSHQSYHAISCCLHRDKRLLDTSSSRVL